MDTHLLKKNALTEVVHIIPKYSLLNETDVSKTVCVCEEEILIYAGLLNCQ